MQAIQQMEAGKIFLIESRASANSVYFETDDIAKLFFRYCDYYLKDFLHIEEYVVNKHGWAMLIKVRSAKTIRKYYEKIEAGRKSKNSNTDQQAPKAIWWILSERVRLFISTYVRMSNKILGREGSLVRNKYGRYKFDSLEAAKAYVSKIRNNQHEMQQHKEKYQGYQAHFRMKGDISTNPLKSSLWVELWETKEQIVQNVVEIFGKKVPVLKGLRDLVAPKIKLNNWKVKSPTNTAPNT